MQALEPANIKAAQRVLIHGGSGGVGHVGVQIAKALGAHVTSTCSTKNMQLVKVAHMRKVMDDIVVAVHWKQVPHHCRTQTQFEA